MGEVGVEMKICLFSLDTRHYHILLSPLIPPFFPIWDRRSKFLMPRENDRGRREH